MTLASTHYALTNYINHKCHCLKVEIIVKELTVTTNQPKIALVASLLKGTVDLQIKIGFVFLTSGEGARQGEVGRRSQETETEKGGGRRRRGRDRERNTHKHRIDSQQWLSNGPLPCGKSQSTG